MAISLLLTFFPKALIFIVLFLLSLFLVIFIYFYFQFFPTDIFPSVFLFFSEMKSSLCLLIISLFSHMHDFLLFVFVLLPYVSLKSGYVPRQSVELVDRTLCVIWESRGGGGEVVCSCSEMWRHEVW